MFGVATKLPQIYPQSYPAAKAAHPPALTPPPSPPSIFTMSGLDDKHVIFVRLGSKEEGQTAEVSYALFTDIDHSGDASSKYPCPLWLLESVLGVKLAAGCKALHTSKGYLKSHLSARGHATIPEVWKTFYGVETCVLVA